MKYCVLIIDGASGWPMPTHGGKTCLELAHTPNLNALAEAGIVGLVRTVPPAMEPSSACACMSVLGYDPQIYYRGRSAIEAHAMGIPIGEGEVVFRCNLVATQDGRMSSYSCGHISTGEGQALITSLNEKLGSDHVHFYPGVSYRHICKIRGREDTLSAICTPPHDIPNKGIAEFLPKGPGSEFLRALMAKSEPVLRDHPINLERKARGDIPATMIWLFWGSGRIPDMPPFKKVYGLDPAVISGVDIVRGLAKMTRMEVFDVPGVTGDMNNDYVAQAIGALKALEKYDMVVIHVEATDEAGHAGLVNEKIKAIEKVDREIVSRLRSWDKDALRVLILPDHSTPIQVQTHVADPVPFILCGPGFAPTGPGRAERFTEAEAKGTGIFIEEGYNVMGKLIEKRGKEMALVVQKYGGSSVADAEKIKNVARRVAKAKDEGNQVVVVVSAMGDTTDDLINLAYQISEQPSDRELDVLLSTGEIVSSTLLAMALGSLGYKALSLSGAQAGIHTDSSYSRARIVRVDTKRVVSELKKENIVIVAGFQGVSGKRDITTLGRGGSDTTAVALAISLGAETCQIYTDVEGVYTADPRLVPQARKLQKIGYEEMLELATYGARVMHNRAVELGWLYNMPILVASSFSDSPGTTICKEASMEIKNKVSGIAHDTNVAKVTVVGVPDHPGIAASIFEPLARANISIDTIVQNASIDNITDLTFTVTRNDLLKAMSIVEPVAKSVGGKRCLTDSTLAKVSIVGTGMQNTPGYAARMFRALYERGINIQLITTSEIRITCIISEDRVKDAVRALHQAFELEKET